MSDVSLRPAVPGDAAKLSELALRSKAYWGYSFDFIDSCRDELTYTADQIEGQAFIFTIAELAGQLAGFYTLEELSSSKFDLRALFVDPDRIGTGIGHALITHARNVAAQNGATHIVVQSDPHALAFYEHIGAVYDGEEESESIPGRYLPTLVISLG
jgi:GNAT superfamily N-acetyltransferase